MAESAIFIPGLLCTRDLFVPQLDELDGRLDITIGDHTLHDNIFDAAKQILEDAPERFVLAGLSMGGHISLEIMRQAAGRVIALMLMDTTARPDMPEQIKFRQELIEMSRNDGLDPVVDILLPKYLGESSQRDPQLVSTVRAMANETGIDAFARQQSIIIGRPDSRPTLGGIECPTLVIVGEGDVLTPPEISQEIASGISGAKLEIIPDAGHLSSLENPAVVNKVIKAFLDEVGRGA